MNRIEIIRRNYEPTFWQVSWDLHAAWHKSLPIAIFLAWRKCRESQAPDRGGKETT